MGEKETKLIRKKQHIYMIMTHNGIVFLFNRHVKVHVCGYLGEHYCSRVRSSDVGLKGLRFLLHTFKLQSVVNA